jgi:ankyrin repeat protein
MAVFRNSVAQSLLCLSMTLVSGLATAQDLRLVEAAKARDAREAADLIAQRVNVNTVAPDGATALHWAAHWSDLETAGRLIAAGANPSSANDYGVTPIFLAATNGDLAMIRALLETRANPNSTLPTGETVLMTAARTGSADVVSLLLEQGADPNARQASKGQTALMWAVSEQHRAVARALLDGGADLHARTDAGFTPLLFAARQGNVDVTRLLLDRGGDVNDVAMDGSTPLLVATVRGHVALAMFLLEQGAMPDGLPETIGYTPLHWASTRSETVVTNDYPEAPGEWAALAGIPDRAGKVSLIEALIANGANVNAPVTNDLPRYGFGLFPRRYLIGGTPFYLAAVVADVEVMRLLLDHGADPNINARDEITPMMVAAGLAHMDNESLVPEGDRLAAVKLTLEVGNDLHAVNANGFNVVHAAAFAGLRTVIEYLDDLGAELNLVAKNGQTPLGITEGNTISGFFADRPDAAVLLRERGGTSSGAVTLEGQIEQQIERQELQAPPDPAASSRDPDQQR